MLNSIFKILPVFILIGFVRWFKPETIYINRVPYYQPFKNVLIKRDSK